MNEIDRGNSSGGSAYLVKHQISFQLLQIDDGFY